NPFFGTPRENLGCNGYKDRLPIFAYIRIQRDALLFRTWVEERPQYSCNSMKGVKRVKPQRGRKRTKIKQVTRTCFISDYFGFLVIEVECDEVSVVQQVQFSALQPVSSPAASTHASQCCVAQKSSSQVSMFGGLLSSWLAFQWSHRLHRFPLLLQRRQLPSLRRRASRRPE